MSLSVSPTNACTQGFYEFSINTHYELSEGDGIYLKFPVEFPESLGTVIGWSEHAKRYDQSLSCTVSGEGRSLIVEGLGTVLAGTTFNLYLDRVNNPCSTGITGSLFIGTTTDSSIKEYIDTLTVTVTSKPRVLDHVLVSLSSYSIKTSAEYSLVVAPTSFSGPIEVWVEFPDMNFE